jgi:hypothetical protein
MSKEIKLIKSIIFANILFIGLGYADNAGVIVESKTIKQSQSLEELKELHRMIQIEEAIENMEKTNKDIKKLLKNKQYLIICSIIDSLNIDISELKKQISKTTIEKKKIRL